MPNCIDEHCSQVFYAGYRHSSIQHETLVLPCHVTRWGFIPDRDWILDILGENP